MLFFFYYPGDCMCVFRRGIASLCDSLTFAGALRVFTKVIQPFYMATSRTYGV